ncbi:MAG TPA: hypothetical protein VG895_04405 [Patescibacteria group bacterium]|nr:hypothetical protein [Patescibacteria group bacterium]
MTETTSQIEEPETTYYSGILYHGAKEPFNFDPKYDYNTATTDGSWTLGPGLYSLHTEEEAKKYSHVRQGHYDYSTHKKPPTHVYSVYANDCKFLDFRNEEGGNTFTPPNIIKKWKSYFEKRFNQEKEEKPDLGPEIAHVEGKNGIGRRIINRAYIDRDKKEKYLKYLEEIEDKSNIHLRKMLGTQPIINSPSGFNGNNYGVQWGNWFADFVVKDLGYDGIIYIEGTEYEKGDASTFIIYNLDSIKVSEKPIQ